MSAPPPTPAERFAAMIAYFSKAVMAHTGWDQRLSLSLIAHIIDRFRTIKRRFVSLATRIQAGRYVRRTVAPHHRAIAPRRPNPLPRTRNWLEPLLPEVVHFRGHLDHLLHDAEVVALITAAPDALGRPLRSLCRMLGLPLPPILAPIREKPPRAAPAAKLPASKASKPPSPEPPPPPRPQPPAWMPRRTRWTLARIRGSPKPA